MTSNKAVTYIDMGLNSVEEYWNGVLVPDVRAFQIDPSSRSLFYAARAIWHLHDWVWHEENPGQDSHSPAFRSYRDGLLDACPELGWLRDIADASKHRGLGRQPEVKGAQPKVVGMYSGLLALTQNVLKFYLVLNDGSHQEADDAVRTTVEFWQTRLGKNLSAP
jgi:hypothetical protein